MHADILRVSNAIFTDSRSHPTRLLLWRKIELCLPHISYTSVLSETKCQTLSSLHHALLPSAPFRRQSFQMYQDNERIEMYNRV